jgi:hypothetical protein
MFEFEHLTARDWILLVLFFLMAALAIGLGVNWLSVSLAQVN